MKRGISNKYKVLSVRAPTHVSKLNFDSLVGTSGIYYYNECARCDKNPIMPEIGDYD